MNECNMNKKKRRKENRVNRSHISYYNYDLPHCEVFFFLSYYKLKKERIVNRNKRDTYLKLQILKQEF